jgi:RimJ/RimL family protein N-acetyltransferase
MLLLTPERAAALRPWFAERSDRPGPQVGLHVLNTGHGACFADRWPDPRAVLVDSAGNYSIDGDPDALDPGDLRDRVLGFVEAPDPFVPLLAEAGGEVERWDRVMWSLDGPPTAPAARAGIRRLGADDAYAVWALTPESAWISKSWGGPEGLVTGGTAWGAFADGRLVSLACAFFVGDRYADVGVVTEPGYRGRGLSATCAARVCEDIAAAGRQASWTTSPDNVASARVAEKLGFTFVRRDVLYAVGVPIPTPP